MTESDKIKQASNAGYLAGLKKALRELKELRYAAFDNRLDIERLGDALEAILQDKIQKLIKINMNR